METKNNNTKKILPKFNYIILGGLLVLSAVGISIGGAAYIQAHKSKDDKTTLQSQPEVQKLPITVIDQNGKSTAYETKNNELEPAIEVLKRLDQESDSFSFEVKEYSFGAMITSINGYTPDPAKQFWSFEVNGKPSSEGISAYRVHNNDNLTFKVENIQ